LVATPTAAVLSISGAAVAGAEPAAFARTHAVVARRVLLSPLEGVGAVGMPVNAGLLMSALPIVTDAALAAEAAAAAAEVAAARALADASVALDAAAAGSA
jgi:hypothetical protein